MRPPRPGTQPPPGHRDWTAGWVRSVSAHAQACIHVQQDEIPALPVGTQCVLAVVAVILPWAEHCRGTEEPQQATRKNLPVLGW